MLSQAVFRAFSQLGLFGATRFSVSVDIGDCYALCLNQNGMRREGRP